MYTLPAGLVRHDLPGKAKFAADIVPDAPSEHGQTTKNRREAIAPVFEQEL
jgi:hypothetical protein